MDVMQELAQAGGVLTDHHFIYKKGEHGPHYINIDPLLPNMGLMNRLAKQLRGPFLADSQVQVITGPPIGGLMLACFTGITWPAAGFGAVEVVCPDKHGDDFAYDRATFAERLNGKRVLVLEDFLTSGSSVKAVCQEAEKHGAEIIGVSAICNRSGIPNAELAESLETPQLKTLAEVDFKKYDPDECPLCEAGVPIVEDLGRGEKYKLEHPDYPGGYVKLLG